MEARLPAATAATAPDLNPSDLRQRLLSLPNRTKIALVAGIVALAGLILWGVQASRQPEWRILYTSLSDKDGGAVLGALAQLNVPYKFAEGGAAILVPADKVNDARMKLASQGLPRGGTVGFELMENQKFGTTQFQERLNFQRGLEGELARSIMSLSAVQAARVHLALPNQTAFLREQQKPSASVLLTLFPGRTLDRAQVAGIVHLVASSVPEMPPSAVSVVDQTGALLSTPPDAKTAGLDAPQLQYVRQTEQALQQRILAILEPMVGAGNVRAQVTADIDFTQSESTAETYGPNQGSNPAAVRSQQLSESAQNSSSNGGAGGAGGAGGGSPGALSNQPPASPASPINGAAGAIGGGAGGTGSGSTRRDATTSYEVDRTVRVVRNQPGTVKRLSAAVLVNYTTPAGPDGKPGKPASLPAAQLEQVQALVREAIGFTADRGDSVQVVNAPFSTPVLPNAEDLPLWRQPEVLEMARTLGPWVALPLLGLIIILGAVRPAIKATKAPPPLLSETVRDAIDLEPLPGGAAGAAGEGGANGAAGGVEVSPDPSAPPLLPTAEAAKQQQRTRTLDAIRDLAKQDPATVANVVRSWTSPPAN